MQSVSIVEPSPVPPTSSSSTPTVSSRRSPSQQQQHPSSQTALRTYSPALSTNATFKASKLLRSATGSPQSARGADSFETIWRERVSGDVILCSIANNNSRNDNNDTSANDGTEHQHHQHHDSSSSSLTHRHSLSPQNRRFAITSGFVEDPGSAFVGIPENILSHAEKNGVIAQFQEGTSEIPRDLTRIRVGLSTALMVSVGVPDDVLYDLLVVGKTGVYLLKQLRATSAKPSSGAGGMMMITNQENQTKTGTHHHDDNSNLVNNKNSENDVDDDNGNDDDDNLTIFTPTSRHQRKKANELSATSSTSSALMKQQQQKHHQFEVSMQALIDVARWIKYQMESDKHPFDAAAHQDSPSRERLEVLNSEVADSVSLFEAASTTAHQNQVRAANRSNSNNNNTNTNKSSPPSNLASATTRQQQQQQQQQKSSSSSASAHLRLTPRAALASVYCEPPVIQQKQRNQHSGSSKFGKGGRSSGSGRSPSLRYNSHQHQSSSSSDSDDDNENDQDSNKKSERKRQKTAEESNENDDAGSHPSSPLQRRGTAVSSSSSSSPSRKKSRPPDVEARKELKKFMAADPWRQTAAALFTSLGGDVFATTVGTLPFPVVERVVRLTLHRRIEHAAVEGAVSSLSSKYRGRRLTLIEFDLDVVRPLARLLGCDSGGGAQQNGQQGDVGVSSQIRAAQHVIKLFMTPASKLAKDEAARFRGKRNFKDSEELLLAAKFSIERVRNRLGELKIIDPHVDRIFKNACILEGTGLTHILDLSRFALQDFVQKVKDNRPIAVNPAMALRRKIVDRFIGAVEKAARTLYDHSSACPRCKRIADVIRNHIAEKRAKDSTFHQQFYERQKTMMMKKGEDVIAEEEEKRKKKERRQRLKMKLKKLRALKRRKDQELLNEQIKKQEESFSTSQDQSLLVSHQHSSLLSKETSLIAMAISDQDNDHDNESNGGQNDNGHDHDDHHHRNETRTRHRRIAERIKKIEEELFDNEDEDEVNMIMEEEEEDDDLENADDLNTSFLLESDDESDSGNSEVKLGIDETFAFVAGDLLQSNNVSAGSFGNRDSALNSPQSPLMDLTKSSSHKPSPVASPIDQTSQLFARTFDSYFSDLNSTGGSTSKKQNNIKNTSAEQDKENNNNNTMASTKASDLVPIAATTRKRSDTNTTKPSSKFEPRPPSAALAENKDSTTSRKNNKNTNSSSPSKNKTTSPSAKKRRRPASATTHPNSKHHSSTTALLPTTTPSGTYLKPKDEIHECRMRSGQVRELFRMIQMKGTTIDRTEKRINAVKDDNGIGPGWKS